jgi:hypothetical protein
MRRWTLGRNRPARASSSPTSAQLSNTRCGAPTPRGVREVRTRFGVVLRHGGGAYPMQAPVARLSLGAVLSHGLQPAPWVHLADAVRMMRFVMEHQYPLGPVNSVARGDDAGHVCAGPSLKRC